MKKLIVLALAVVLIFTIGIFIVGNKGSSVGGNTSEADTPGVESLMGRGWLALEDGDWQRADEFFERVLDIDHQHAPAYLGKLCAELNIKAEADLANHVRPLDDMRNYQRALQFADARYKAKVTGYNQAIMARMQEHQIGSIIQLGGYNWRVLDVKDGKALIITENIIERRPYNVDAKEITWETCTLRKYLNGEFLQTFTNEEQGRIAETRISNPDNLWYGTTGGNDTVDKVFLLSLEEVNKYFGDSGDYQNKRRKEYSNGKWVSADNGYGFSNANDSDRAAHYSSQASWWWLRSPGCGSSDAASVGVSGGVIVNGLLVGNVHNGVRPALWLNL